MATGHCPLQSANSTRSIASWRAPVERAVAHMKNWKILATGYHGMLERLPIILETITMLETYRAWSTF